MASIVESDGSGRIVIPKKVRDELGIGKKTQFILTTNRKGQILIQKLDLEEITQRLEEELAETPLEQQAEQIREEINEKVKKAYKALAGQ